MTDPGPDADLEHRFAALWEHVRHQDEHIRNLETWRAGTAAVSAWRRWALPTLLSILGLALSLVNALLLLLPHP